MRAALLVLGAALAACAAGPDYHAPDESTAPLANAGAAHFTAAGFEGQWWARFGDPRLDELVAEALAGNRELRVAVARVREARALLDDAAWDRFPEGTPGAAYTRARSQGLGTQRVTTESWRAGLDTSWEIDLFGRVSRGVEAARAQAGAAEADLRAAQVSVIAEVARNYFELRGTQRRLAVAQQNRDKQRETLRLTDVRREAGAGSELETVSARARLAAVEATVPQFEAATRRARHRLAVLLGERPGALDERLAEPAAIPVARELAIGDAAQLVRRRPDVHAAERRLAAATARVGVATAELYPRLSVSAFVGFFTGLGSVGALDAGARAWSVTPALVWPGLDLDARARVRAAGAQSQAALATYEQAVLLALEETENALAGYGSSRERLAKLVEQAAASARAAELARIRYREGASDFLVLLDAERTQLQAEDALAEGESVVNTAAVAVYRALGGGWDVVPSPAAAEPPAAVLGRKQSDAADPLTRAASRG